MNRLILLLVSICLCSTTNAQQTITLRDGSIQNGVYPTIPTRNIEYVEDGIIVTYFFSKAIIQQDPLFNNCFLWKCTGFGINDTPAEPAYLSRVDNFTVPYAHNASLELLESAYIDFNCQLPPARQPLIDSGNESYTKENISAISPYKGFAPTSIVSTNAAQIYRGRSLMGITICPIQYNYETKVVRAYTRIKYKVTFREYLSSPSEDANLKAISDDNILSNITINGNTLNRERATDSSSNSNKGYLIISTPKFALAVNRFAEWKKLLGFKVDVILRDNWTPATIKSEVKLIYENSDDLRYLLIIGDHEDVPGETSSLVMSHVTDLHYGCMDNGTDYIPDIYRGRLPVSTLNEACIVIDKIIKYEQNPVRDPAFYENGLNCTFFQDNNNDSYEDQRFAKTTEELCSYLITLGKKIERIYKARSSVTPKYWNDDAFSFGEEMPKELQKNNFAWDGNSADIVRVINKGVFYALHRGHGAVDCWIDPAYNTTNISQLSNNNKLPIIFSMNCETGMYNGRTCFSEAFLRKENGGCVAIYSATETSYSGYNDALIEGMFDAIWPSPGIRPIFPFPDGTGSPTPTPTYELGQILDQGMFRMAETYGLLNSRYANYTRELFHCFGDPSMKIYTSMPTAFTNVTIQRNRNNITVTLPNDDACITFYDAKTEKVTSNMGNSAYYSADSTKNVIVCISAHNKIPYINYDDQFAVKYIQNESISSPFMKAYRADVIKIGSDVTPLKERGSVLIEGQRVILFGEDIEINSETEISEETDLIIQNSK